MKIISGISYVLGIATLVTGLTSCKARDYNSDVENVEWSGKVETEVEAAMKSQMTKIMKARFPNDPTIQAANYKFDLRDVWSRPSKLNQNQTGGRSWTKDDELGFSDWIDRVPTNILETWKIPHDCADAVLALRWMYAVQNGLALMFTTGYNSISYKNDPVALLRNAAMALPQAPRMVDGAYQIDLTNRNNYRGGVIVDTGHHVIILRGAIRFKEAANPSNTNLLDQFKDMLTGTKEDSKVHGFTTLSSTSPTDRRTLREYPFDYTSTSGAGIDYMSFGRYYPVKNNGGSLSWDKGLATDLFPAKTAQSDTLVNHCSSGSLLWLNLINYLWAVDHWEPTVNGKKPMSRSAAEINSCDHNKAASKDPSQFPSVDYVGLFNQFVADVCPRLQLRAQVVNEGFEHCYQTGASKCSTDPEDDFSTPGRDTALHRSLKGLAGFAGQINKMPKSGKIELNKISCTIDMLQFQDKRTEASFKKRFVNFAGAQGNQLLNHDSKLRKKTFHPFAVFGAGKWDDFSHMNPAPITTDPKASYPARWGCPSNDVMLNCLQ